ncbi:hypothetical protein TWF694_000462 [Orbilia ellipsospora]|uniref:Uncharacterized protein n=1 Tax=Orbilia ellipsospora TaxID=2528407 RepID=A0AAV9XNR5_9PEZI
MKQLTWPTLLVFGASVFLHASLSIQVAAYQVSVPKKEVEQFIQTNFLAISRFQKSMRQILPLWDENRVGGNDIPLTLDLLSGKLKEKLKALIQIEEEERWNGKATLASYGFATVPIPKDETKLGYGDSTIDRVLYNPEQVIQEAQYARQIFWSFLIWVDAEVGMMHWFRSSVEKEYKEIAPKLFKGKFTKDGKFFIFDSHRRVKTRDQFTRYINVFNLILERIGELQARTFRMGPKLDIAAEVKFLYEGLIKVIMGWRDVVKDVRYAYNAIPPLDRDSEDADVEESLAEEPGISEVPLGVQSRKGAMSPGLIVDILNEKTVQEGDEARSSPLELLEDYPQKQRPDLYLAACLSQDTKDPVLGRKKSRCDVF